MGTNSNSYTQIKISVAPELASKFKMTCAKSNVSMASIIARFMADYSNATLKKRAPSPDYSTKRKRRLAVQRIIRQLEQIRDFEELYHDKIPENLGNSMVYENADQAVSALEEVIEMLDIF